MIMTGRLGKIAYFGRPREKSLVDFTGQVVSPYLISAGHTAAAIYIRAASDLLDQFKVPKLLDRIKLPDWTRCPKFI